jgi:hypothetical protein
MNLNLSNVLSSSDTPIMGNFTLLKANLSAVTVKTHSSSPTTSISLALETRFPERNADFASGLWAGAPPVIRLCSASDK